MPTPQKALTRIAVLVEFDRQYARGLLEGINHFALEQNTFIEIEPGEVIPRESTRLAGISDPLVQRTLIFIRDHACDGIVVGDVLAHVGASRRSLERKLKKAIGRSPHQENHECEDRTRKAAD